ncbi:MAG: hypothetical protein J2P46_05040 [Zavarzinella sp.]|nr:hypothetical protein [Zavarzinella sp.]
MAVLLENIRHFVAVRVYAGFASEPEVVVRAIDDWECSWEEDGRPPADLRAFVERTTGELFEQHRREQARWPERTDCDRLDAAFAELDGLGILARQNYEQTLTSGCAAIEAEAARERSRRPVLGFVFFHEQDTESAVCWNSGPSLAWGAFEDGDEAWRRVAQAITEVLGRHGIKSEWRGASNSRIFITGLRWRRRRPAR